MERFPEFLSSMRWQDGVDIVLNSYILFRLYVLFRGTNAIRVLIGIVFLWFFQRVSVSLGLIITSWAIQGIIAVAALIIIVVFRNEIRSILQARNLRGILWGVPRSAVQKPVEIIVESVFEMARARVGALLVLPGEDDLTEVVHGGIPWEGRISKEMIVSIFWPENPVHDGAAIIRGDQVTEVGALIPLSHRKDLPSYYGTRHRAAAGLAEATDALVIAVSEERGQVSVARGQEFRVVQDTQELQGIVQTHGRASTGQTVRTGKEKIEFAVAAALSVLFIGGVWFSFTRGMDTFMTLQVPIEYMNRDPGMEILDASQNAVSLELSGSGALIRSVTPEQVKVRLDLAGAVPGSNAFPITTENVSLPPGIALRSIKTSGVEVLLDVSAKKELPVQVDWVGKLPEGLLISEARLEPERIHVTGPRGALDKIHTIYTEKLMVDHLDKSGSITVKLALPLPSLKVAGGSKDRVVVDYVVKERAQ